MSRLFAAGLGAALDGLQVKPFLVRELVTPELGFLLVGECDLEALDLLFGVLGLFVALLVLLPEGGPAGLNLGPLSLELGVFSP